MSAAAPLQAHTAKPQANSNSAHAGLLLQRKCACGSATSSLTGNCAECSSNKRLQAKLAIGASNDPLEQEADRIADQVLAGPAPLVSSGAPPRIQRFAAQPTGSVNTAPASVERVLTSPGRPLEPALEQDMGQRFGHDFSRVRVHAGAAAEQSAREVNAHAYTVGQDIVFGAGRFAPGTLEGRRLIAHELTHVVQRSGSDGVRAGQNNGNRGLSPIPRHAAASLLLRQPAGTAYGFDEYDKDFVRGTQTSPTSTQYELSEQVWKSLFAFSARANSELPRVRKSVDGFLKRYDAAYATFTARLSAAQKEAAAREKLANVMMGLVIGTGVGLAAHGLYTATTIVGKIAYEVAAQGAKAGIGGALGGSSAPDFTPPAELSADTVARGYLEKLLDAWDASAPTTVALAAFEPLRDALRAAASEADPPAKGGTRKTTVPDVSDELERLKASVDVADKALTTFLTTADSPLLRRDELTVEQDIWIAWMGRGSANAKAVWGDDPIGRRLKELGILGRLMRSGEGGVMYREGERVSELARDEQARVGKIGHVGVVIVPPRPATGQGQTRPGVARVRHDAYAAVGRADPEPTGAERYVQILWEPRTFLRPGEVVMVSSTTASGLEVERLGPSLAVATDERTFALQLLSIKEPEYQPEAAETLWPSVWGAVNSYLKDEPPPLQLSSSEDGVLVSESDGKKLVLFAPLTDSGRKGAELRRDRSGALRVVAIELDPKQVVYGPEFRDAKVLMTDRSDMSFIADEIRAARHAP